MKYCRYCQVYIRGKTIRCPLCSNILPSNGNNGEDLEIFPHIPPSYEAHLALRIMIFISIATVIASFALYQIFPTDVNWPILVALGIVSMWLSLSIIIRKRHNITKNIMWQVTVVSLLSIVWDWRTGWRGWSLNYAIPTACVVAMFVMYVLARIMKLSVRDYIVYFLLDGLFGIIPSLFILLGWIDILYPSIICVAVSIIFLSAIFIFQGDNIKAELARRMHI